MRTTLQLILRHIRGTNFWLGPCPYGWTFCFFFFFPDRAIHIWQLSKFSEVPDTKTEVEHFKIYMVPLQQKDCHNWQYYFHLKNCCLPVSKSTYVASQHQSPFRIHLGSVCIRDICKGRTEWQKNNPHFLISSFSKVSKDHMPASTKMPYYLENASFDPQQDHRFIEWCTLEGTLKII